MIDICTVAEVREAEEQAFAVLGDADAPDGGSLMQRAAAGLAGVIIDSLHELRVGTYGARVLVLAGGGNNGGDALYAGLRLARRGVRVLVCRVAEKVHAGGWQACLTAGVVEVDPGAAIELIMSGGADVVVDGVLGIGGRSGLTGVAAELAGACVAARAYVIAVDLPSGLAADLPGAADSAFRADRTVTFGAHKLCQYGEPAASACGRVTMIDIGLTTRPGVVQWEPADVAHCWPVPGPTDDKYSRGVVGIDTGSDAYPGAGLLSTLGAVYAGAGMVRFLGASHPRELIMGTLPNVVHAPGRVQAYVLGSGWGERADGDRVVADAVDAGVPVVLDADGLRHLPTGRVAVPLLLTPHAGELARLLDTDRHEVEADPITAVRAAVDATGATVLLKGATQYVAGPDTDTTALAVPGPAWTAQAGSGDVLAGICGTLLAAGLSPATAALAGASLQAMTAVANPGPYPPHELARTLPATIAELVPPEHRVNDNRTRQE
ncbi:bifunctional ADP-dependent NAD(P)H-hydrate dehydratase/NAD(P)H-hydrate epimerase [Microlunatus sp. Y2014]|uniref:bifunctional ADP-dependent NAD(P)H-hydrate dehydratase/NAD(P)H-hydrate epimerase n=1 Tax=Microlunatus sp. Y2014 TaxID=3418488 RepID=UPI003DA7918A